MSPMWSWKSDEQEKLLKQHGAQALNLLPVNSQPTFITYSINLTVISLLYDTIKTFVQ